MRQERATRTRQLLVRQAAEAFAVSGYQGASVVGIARAAGVSAGALHFHFPSKHTLSNAVREAGIPALRKLVLHLGTRRGEPLQQLIDLSQLVVAWLARDATVRTAVRMHRELPTAPPGCADFCALWLHEMRSLTAIATREGQVRPGLAPGDVDELVAAVTVGAELLAGPRGRCRTVTEVAASWRLILPGMVGEAAAGRLDVFGTLRLEDRSPVAPTPPAAGRPPLQPPDPPPPLPGDRVAGHPR